MKRVMTCLALGMVAVVASPQAMAQCAAPIYNSDASVFSSDADFSGAEPDTVFPIGGSGIGNGAFSRCDDSSGIQLGLRVSERSAGTVWDVDDMYDAPQGAATDGNAQWNIEYHIDMGWAYGDAVAPLELGDLGSLVLQMDCDPAVGVVAGPAVDLSRLSAFLPTLFPPTAILIQGSDNLGFPLRCPGMDFDPAADGSYEFSLTATDVAGTVISQATATAVVGNPPEPPPPGENATFTVVAAYTDLNPAPVDVQLTCNGGLPLEQSYTLTPITEGESNIITFTLTNFEDGVTDCVVTQTPAAGYTTEYEDFSGIGSADADGCHYDDVTLGTEAICGIGNVAGPVAVTISKVWAAGDLSASGDLMLNCVNVVPDTQDSWEWPVSTSIGDMDYVADVAALATAVTTCTVTEMVDSSAVESSGCETPIVVATGDTGAGCTLVNTVFYEGVPTLNQYGMALLALLMLGVGFVGFRRFA